MTTEIQDCQMLHKYIELMSKMCTMYPTCNLSSIFVLSCTRIDKLSRGAAHW